MDEKYKLIKNECLNSDTRNPIELILSIMKMTFTDNALNFFPLNILAFFITHTLLYLLSLFFHSMRI